MLLIVRALRNEGFLIGWDMYEYGLRKIRELNQTGEDPYYQQMLYREIMSMLRS